MLCIGVQLFTCYCAIFQLSFITLGTCTEDAVSRDLWRQADSMR
jgi:hypothetical protein